MINFSGVLRKLAAIISLTVALTAPGVPAWAQVAGAVRPVSIGAGLTGSAGASVSPLPTMIPMSVSVAPTSLPSGFAVSAFVPPASAEASASAAIPAARAISVAAASALSVARSVNATGLVAARATVSAASGLENDGGSRASESAFGRLGRLFDGLLNRPAQDAATVPGSENEPSDNGLSRSNGQDRRILVRVTLTDPGSPEALQAVVGAISKNTGFTVDPSVKPSRAGGKIVLQGAVPVSSLIALRKTPGVEEIEGVSLPGGASIPVPGSAAAESGSVFASALRGQIQRGALSAQLATITTLGLNAVAFMGPVMAAFLGGPLGAFMTIGAIGMATGFSYLEPMTRKIPFALRAGAAIVGLAGATAVSFGTIPATLTVLAAGNAVLAGLALLRNGASVARSASDAPVTKLVKVTEGAMYVNIIGYSLAALAIASVMPVLAVVMLVSAAMIAPFLFATKTPAPRMPVGPEGPTGPGTNFTSPLPAAKVVAAARQPFVPATRTIGELEALEKADPAAARAKAKGFLANDSERRTEVKIASLRVLERAPIAETLSFYAEIIKKYAAPGVQISKELGHDRWWYYQREIIAQIARNAGEIKPSAELIESLKASFRDRNASVRLMAALALTKFGVETGPEPTYPARSMKGYAPAGNQMGEIDSTPTMPHRMAPAPRSPLGRWIIGLGVAAILAITFMAYNGNNSPTQPVARPGTVQVDSLKGAAAADSLKAAPTDSVKPAENRIDSLDRIATSIEKSAQSNERAAKALEEMSKPKPTSIGSVLFMIALAILPIFLLVWLMRRSMRGAAGGGPNPMSMTKQAGKLEKSDKRFDDVAGMDESMVEVEEIVDFMRNPGRYTRMGARVPKGVLLEGPPGTGKTLLAKALAGETDAVFISMSGSEFVEMFVGMGASRVRELFNKARQAKPALIFIDEIDAVGKARGNGGPANGGNDEREQTINQLLKEMDGFDNSDGIVVVAATNRADTLDPALTRPGRFDRKVFVGLPQMAGREAILALHGGKVRLAAETDFRNTSRRSTGMSGAFLEGAINEAALLAVRRGADAIEAEDLDEAVDRVTIGGKRSLKLADNLKKRIAFHETGHVLANVLNEKPELRTIVNKVTIIPHGSAALGFAESGTDDGDKYLYTKEELEARLDTIVGGMVAEKIIFGSWSTGPDNDLEQGTRIARLMVERLGMSEELGLLQTSQDRNNPFGGNPFGDAVAAKVHAAAAKILKDAFDRVEKRLTDNRDKLDALATALLQQETITADDIQAIAYPKK